MTRQAVPSNVAGTRPPSLEWITSSTGWANSCSCVPERAHQAVTSRASGPGPNPFVKPLGAAVGAMRRTIQSFPEVDQAPAGIVAEANPSAEPTVVGDDEVVFFSTYGAEPDEYTVKWTRNGVFLPLGSWSAPASVCGPAASAPVP